jgi:chromosome segregation ATPase
MVENIENEKDKELIHKLASVSGFKGLMEQWIKPAAKKYELCFQIMLGSLLKYIICTDDNASKQIAVKLRENGQIRTLVILDNVN